MKGRKGPESIYGPKDHPAKTVLLSKLGKNILQAAAERGGGAESNVVEHLLRKHGGSIAKDELKPLPQEEPAA